MASKGENGEIQPNLKICIDNVDNTSEMEEGEVEDSSEEEVTPIKRRKQHRRERKLTRKMPDPSLDPVLRHERPLPSPVESDDEQTLTVGMDDLETFGVTKQLKPKIYENKTQGNFELGFDPLSEEAQKKKIERAKRFGITPGPEVVQLDEDELKKLYESLGVSKVAAGERGMRLEAIHLRGVNDMSTEDIFNYFQTYIPSSIEWIDDSSCNVIWNDRLTAARAILGRSEDPNKDLNSEKKPSQSDKTGEMEIDLDENKENKDRTTTNGENEQEENGTSKPSEKRQESMEEEDDDELNLLSSDEDEVKDKKNQKQVKKTEKKDYELTKEMTEVKTGEDLEKDKAHSPETVSDTTITTTSDLHQNRNMIKRILPPGNWRIGYPCEKTKILFMRFANKADKKLPGAERKSHYYREYGNPNFGGMMGLISASRKRRFKNTQYRKESEEAHEVVRKSEKYYHGIPEETSFDQHLREAQRARKLRLKDKKKSGEEHSSASSDQDDTHDQQDDDYYNNAADDDLSGWGRLSDAEREDEEGKMSNQEEELDMELELGELMKKAPVYRMGRMHADDLEEQLKAKKDAAKEMARQMMAATDARRQIDHNRYQRHSAATQRHHHTRRPLDEGDKYGSDDSDAETLQRKINDDDSGDEQSTKVVIHETGLRSSSSQNSHRSRIHHRVHRHHHEISNQKGHIASVEISRKHSHHRKHGSYMTKAKERHTKRSTTGVIEVRTGSHKNRRQIAADRESDDSESEDDIDERIDVQVDINKDSDVVDDIEEEEDDDDLRLDDSLRSDFKYEKLKIHVDPDDV